MYPQEISMEMKNELQVADYCCWAIFRKHEHKDATHYSGIKSAVWSEFDIFQSGTTYYYR